MRDPFWQPPYSFTEEVAKEARAASRNYWAGVNDRYPVNPDVYRKWFVKGDDRDKVVHDAILRHRKGRRL
jgi:hypothetical protein